MHLLDSELPDISEEVGSHRLLLSPIERNRQEFTLQRSTDAEDRSNSFVPKSIKIAVKNGEVTLEGTCEWWYQRDAAEQAVRYLSGAKHVYNHIVIKPHLSPVMVKEKIEDALRRSAQVEAKDIRVIATGGILQDRGPVRSSCRNAKRYDDE
jgi:osmotically-inducible protein OsmY